VSPTLAIAQIRDGGAAIVRSRGLAAAAGADAADAVGQEAQLFKLRQVRSQSPFPFGFFVIFTVCRRWTR
jgi:hypothetical protein